MKVIVAQTRGFCHGVRNAISMAEEVLKKKGFVYSLGPLIHNKDVVDRLAASGLKTVDGLQEINGGTVLIRSHGAAAEQISELRAKGCEIVDATCILVKRLQQIARQLVSEGYRVVVIGDEDHPEVQAVVGSCGDVVVVADQSDVHNLPRDKKLGIVCQTTESPEHFGDVLSAIARLGLSEFKVINTLCKEAVKRQESAVDLCKQVDIMFVLGGLESSNTRRLVELCRRYNRQTYHLQNWGELDKALLIGKNIAGVTAGASTPEWIIQEFVRNLVDLDSAGA